MGFNMFQQFLWPNNVTVSVSLWGHSWTTWRPSKGENESKVSSQLRQLLGEVSSRSHAMLVGDLDEVALYVQCVASFSDTHVVMTACVHFIFLLLCCFKFNSRSLNFLLLCCFLNKSQWCTVLGCSKQWPCWLWVSTPISTVLHTSGRNAR